MGSSLTLPVQAAPTIEQGYFVFTLMPSLRCDLNCPHCYLSLDQRRSSAVMPLVDLQLVCDRISEYYAQRAIAEKIIVCYWYGGEPTSMGQAYMQKAMERINTTFSGSHGYRVRHVVLSSMINVDSGWYRLFDTYCDGYVQSSYDGLMRGAGYLRAWERSMRAARAHGLRLGTISVVNRSLLEAGPESTLDYLADLGVWETSWLPFMLNEQNASSGAFDRFAPTMSRYSDFMIRLTEHYHVRVARGLPTPMIGQREFIVRQGQGDSMGNIAGQTLFLLPNGDFALPDYRENGQEYLRVFGNGLKGSFESILASPERRSYIRKQVLRNHNPECQDCPHAGRCVMEFFKTNRAGDDCFGARRYVEWLLANESREVIQLPSQAVMA